MGDSYYYLLCAHGVGGYGVCTCYMQAQRRTPGLRLYYSLSCLLETGSLIEPKNKLLASKLQWSSCLCPPQSPNTQVLPGHTQLYLVSYVCVLRIWIQVHKFVPQALSSAEPPPQPSLVCSTQLTKHAPASALTLSCLWCMDCFIIPFTAAFRYSRITFSPC